MSAIEDLLAAAMATAGARSAVLVDCASGLTVAGAGEDTGVSWDEGAAGSADLLRAMTSIPAFADLRPTEVIITGPAEYQLLTHIPGMGNGRVYLLMRLDRKTGNLALARHHIAAVRPVVDTPEGPPEELLLRLREGLRELS